MRVVGAEHDGIRQTVGRGKDLHWLNGAKVIDFVINSPEMQVLLSKSKFKENPGFHSDREGHIMFQHHGQKVYFKNIRIRKL
jgi:hypothetical protein